MFEKHESLHAFILFSVFFAGSEKNLQLALRGPSLPTLRLNLANCERGSGNEEFFFWGGGGCYVSYCQILSVH